MLLYYYQTGFKYYLIRAMQPDNHKYGDVRNLLKYNSLINKSLVSINDDIKLLELNKVIEKKNEEIQQLKKQIQESDQERLLYKRQTHASQFELQTVKSMLNEIKWKNHADHEINRYQAYTDLPENMLESMHQNSQQQSIIYLEGINQELRCKLELVNYFLNNLIKIGTCDEGDKCLRTSINKLGYFIRFTDYSVKVLEKELCLLEQSIVSKIERIDISRKALSTEKPQFMNSKISADARSLESRITNIPSYCYKVEPSSRNKRGYIRKYETFNSPALNYTQLPTRNYSINDSILSTKNQISHEFIPLNNCNNNINSNVWIPSKLQKDEAAPMVKEIAHESTNIAASRIDNYIRSNTIEAVGNSQIEKTTSINTNLKSAIITKSKRNIKEASSSISSSFDKNRSRNVVNQSNSISKLIHINRDSSKKDARKMNTLKSNITSDKTLKSVPKTANSNMSGDASRSSIKGLYIPTTKRICTKPCCAHKNKKS